MIKDLILPIVFLGEKFLLTIFIPFRVNSESPLQRKKENKPYSSFLIFSIFREEFTYSNYSKNMQQAECPFSFSCSLNVLQFRGDLVPGKDREIYGEQSEQLC